MPDLAAVIAYFKALQQQICATIESADGAALFAIDDWQKSDSYHGSTRVMRHGAAIEQGAVNFSIVQGTNLPPAASARYPQLAGAAFTAVGVSLILHPQNPYVPTTHMNVRYFQATPPQQTPIWWFGGGYDLTPFYPFSEDCAHWHKTAHAACEPFGADVYPRFKKWCDEYFYLPHRNEQRGIGGIFFDDLNCWDFATCFAFVKSIGNSFVPAYLPILQRRKTLPFDLREREFQLYRRGRYVEFNLIYDRGTLFGLQSNGRTESILVSLPPLVRWEYNLQLQSESKEALLHAYLQPRDWLSYNNVEVAHA